MSEQQEGYIVHERYVSHPRQQWEYLQEEIPQAQWQVRLTELGAEGWELVMQYVNYKGGGVQEEDGVLYAVAGTPCWLCFFKRPKAPA